MNKDVSKISTQTIDAQRCGKKDMTIDGVFSQDTEISSDVSGITPSSVSANITAVSPESHVS